MSMKKTKRGHYQMIDGKMVHMGPENPMMKMNMGPLFGVKDLTPEKRKMYEEILEEGRETTPLLVHRNYPNKKKCYMHFGSEPEDFERKRTKSKPKSKGKKKDCGCK